MKKAAIFMLCILLALPVLSVFSIDRGSIYALAGETENSEDNKDSEEKSETTDKGQSSTKDEKEADSQGESSSDGNSSSGGSESSAVQTEGSGTETVMTATETVEDAGGLNVKITLTTAQAWVHTSTDVNVKVKNLDKKRKLKIKSVQAKIGQNGTWNDITEEMKLTISENCAVYVRVTDADGNTCERNRYIECFDKDAPTLNAAVNDGLLSVQCRDTQSGVKAVYVNGYKFTKLTDGTLNIRLQKFDAGYQYFTIQAMDNAGNMSEVYKTPNPYYTDPQTENNAAGKADPKEQLPTNAQATAPTQAVAGVTEHTRTDSNGNVMQAYGNTGKSDDSDKSGGISEKGKEFYTIRTDNEKVFYLVIDRSGEEETVHFLTDVSENDLLNVTQQNNETLPQNSAALESAIPTDAALPNNIDGDTLTDVIEDELFGTETEAPETEEESTGGGNLFYIILGVIGVVAIAAGYYVKVVKKKQDAFEDEDAEDEDDPDFEDYEEETENEEKFHPATQSEDGEKADLRKQGKSAGGSSDTDGADSSESEGQPHVGRDTSGRLDNVDPRDGRQEHGRAGNRAGK